MEWVEVTARTVEEAKEAALDQLGVDEHDAEFEVLEEPRGGLFGRLRSEARVRARIRPTQARPKEERRDRRRRRRPASDTPQPERPRAEAPRAAVAREVRDEVPSTVRETEVTGDGEGKDVPLEEQAAVGREFLEGLVSQFNGSASVSVEPVDDTTIRLAVNGDNLGLLIGPKGQTLAAIQELVRTVVQRRTAAREGWLVVDVANYRQKRQAALERFAREIAAKVQESGTKMSLEPMSPADRKIVHDAINDLAGVTTTSEGEEPRRHVVILPEPT